MDYLIIIGLIFLGILLFLVELFLIPGISLAGLAALGSLLYACVFAFTELGTTGGFATLFAIIVLCTIATIWFMQSRTLDKLSLKKELKASIDNQAERSIQPGEQGITTTRLALIGMADFGGKSVEVKSIDGFIDERTRIIVERIADGQILVKRC